MIVITLSLNAVADPADAKSSRSSAHGSRYAAALTRGVAYRGASSGHYGHYGRYGYHHTALRSWASSGLQCVPFARENTGIELSGNAVTWWDKAEGLYERGAQPEVGSILNFRATGRMRMGHVAVVTNVLDGRHIQIDHANWSAPGRISRDIDVVDVSASNDWTAVRVEMNAESNEFGSVYPTYGFIYDRPDNGTMLANNTPAPAPVLNAPPSDYRTSSERLGSRLVATAPEEVAEAVDDEAVVSRAMRHGSRSRGRYARAGHSRMATASAARRGDSRGEYQVASKSLTPHTATRTGRRTHH